MIDVHIHPDGTLVLLYPQPDRLVTSNHREHWAKIQPTKAAWRDTATMVARQCRVGSLSGRWEVTMLLPVATNRRRDPHNVVGTIVKWTIDGLVRAGVWPDDDPQYVKVVEPEFRVTKDALVQVRLFPL